MLKNLSKATIFYPYSHDNTPLESPLNKGGLRGVLCFFKIGWLARLKGYKVSLQVFFHPESFRDSQIQSSYATAGLKISKQIQDLDGVL